MFVFVICHWNQSFYNDRSTGFFNISELSDFTFFQLLKAIHFCIIDEALKQCYIILYSPFKFSKSCLFISLIRENKKADFNYELHNHFLPSN